MTSLQPARAQIIALRDAVAAPGTKSVITDLIRRTLRVHPDILVECHIEFSLPSSSPSLPVAAKVENGSLPSSVRKSVDGSSPSPLRKSVDPAVRTTTGRKNSRKSSIPDVGALSLDRNTVSPDSGIITGGSKVSVGVVPDNSRTKKSQGVVKAETTLPMADTAEGSRRSRRNRRQKDIPFTPCGNTIVRLDDKICTVTPDGVQTDITVGSSAPTPADWAQTMDGEKEETKNSSQSSSTSARELTQAQLDKKREHNFRRSQVHREKLAKLKSKKSPTDSSLSSSSVVTPEPSATTTGVSVLPLSSLEINDDCVDAKSDSVPSDSTLLAIVPSVAASSLSIAAGSDGGAVVDCASSSCIAAHASDWDYPCAFHPSNEVTFSDDQGVNVLQLRNQLPRPLVVGHELSPLRVLLNKEFCRLYMLLSRFAPEQVLKASEIGLDDLDDYQLAIAVHDLFGLWIVFCLKNKDIHDSLGERLPVVVYDDKTYTLGDTGDLNLYYCLIGLWQRLCHFNGLLNNECSENGTLPVIVRVHESVCNITLPHFLHDDFCLHLLFNIAFEDERRRLMQSCQ
nr:hypothetical protein [Blunervirus sp.]